MLNEDGSLLRKVIWIVAAALISILVISVAEYFVLTAMFGSTPSSSSPTSQQQIAPITTDLNWGGYAVATDFNNPQAVVTGVSGSWVVPTVKTSLTDAFSAIWVGIGGTFGNTLIQVGTEQDSINGAAEYSAWYEMLPSDSVTIQTINVSPGDAINASVTLTNSNENLWRISISDLTTGQSFSHDFVYFSSELSAEWTVERPSVNNVLSPLADISTVTFANCKTIVETCTGNLGQFEYVQNLMSNRQRVPLVQVSNVNKEGLGFSVAFLQSQ